jgi:hypothetical protein
MGINRILPSKDGFRTGAAAYVDPAVFAEKDLHHLFFLHAPDISTKRDRCRRVRLSPVDPGSAFNCGPDAGEILRKAVATSRLALDAQ